MRVQRVRRIAAPLGDVWSVAADPYRLPRWWPRTERVEAVSERGWTSVMVGPSGRGVRADYTVTASTPPTHRRWSLDVAGSPFEKLLTAEETELRVQPADSGTEVTLTLRQRPRGWARLGGTVLRRAAKRTLDDALAGLDRATTDPAEVAGETGSKERRG